MPGPVFSPGERYTICARCHRPFEVPIEGGDVFCGECGAPTSVGPRETRTVAEVAPSPPQPELQRIEALRRQDGKPLLPPAGIAPLIEAGTIPPHRVQEAILAWQGSRREVVTTGSYEAAGRLHFLTMMLGQTEGAFEAPLDKRALYESAIDVIPIPRFRQELLCDLSRLAARHGESRAARAWLALCDSKPADIDMDSSYRIARAYLETKDRQWPAVIDALGEGADDIPIADHMDVLAWALQAHAWEMLGQPDRALPILEKASTASSASLRRIVEKHGLCPVTYPQAAQARTQHAAESVGAASGGSIGKVLLGVAVLQGLIGLGLLVLVGLQLLGLFHLVDLEPTGEDLGPIPAGVVMIGVAVVLGLMGYRMYAAGAKARRLLLHGMSTTAELQSIGRTGTTVNDVPQYRLDLLVRVPEGGNQPATTKLLLDATQVGSFVQGAILKVKIDPAHPGDVVLDPT